MMGREREGMEFQEDSSSQDEDLNEELENANKTPAFVGRKRAGNSKITREWSEDMEDPTVEREYRAKMKAQEDSDKKASYGHRAINEETKQSSYHAQAHRRVATS